MHSLLSVFLFAAPMTSDYSDLQAALAKQDFQLADRLTRDHLDRIVNRLPPVENASGIDFKPLLQLNDPFSNLLTRSVGFPKLNLIGACLTEFLKS